MVKKNPKTTKKRKSSSSTSTSTTSNQPTSQKCAPTGQEREDLGPQARARFAALTLEIQYPDTAILLLASAERPVLLAAAEALARYGSQGRGNLERLFDLRVADSVLALLRHEDVFTRRFALKLLALMSAVPNVQAHLLKDDKYIVSFTEMLDAEDDVFLQEFASRILAELTSDPRGSAGFLEKFKDVSLMFGKLKSEDPDIRKNCVEIVDNLLRDLSGLEAVFRSKDFSFEAIYELFKEPYPVVQQLALNVIELLVMHSTKEIVQESFRLSGGPHYLLDILDNNEWKDLFDKVVGVLNLCCDNSESAELMNSSDGTKRLFAFMENLEDDDKLKFRVLDILVNLAGSMSGKKVLHELGFIEFLFGHMESILTTEIQATICQGFAKMTRYIPSAAKISEGNPMNYIIHLLNNDRAKWTERQAAAFALKELFVNDYQNCINFIDFGGQVHLTHIIKQKDAAAVPWEIQATIIQALSAMADYPRLLDDLIDFDLFSALCSQLDPATKSPDELRIACCTAFSQFCASEEARRLMIRANLQCKIHCLLVKSTSLPVLDALARLIIALSFDDYFARLCAHEGCLFHMLKNHSMSRVLPSWNTCIEALFGADLSMKFAYTGRLCLRDVTDDGFHVMRHSFCPFPLLEDLFRLKLCPLQPIYVANFGSTLRTGDDDEDNFQYLTSKCAAFKAAREAMKRRSFEEGIRVSDGTINAWLELKFGRLQPDPDLVSYLEQFKAELVAAEKPEDGILETSQVAGLVKTSRLAFRARKLGAFVARQLSGTDPSKHPTCLEQQLEVHLRAIKERLETSVIPLGLLRVGSYLERALLFKVMADKIALPASLVRGCFGKSWVELAVPTVRVNDCEETEVCQRRVGSVDELPAYYLRENFIVDLMDEPGELIRIGSSKAERYHEKRSICKFACCENKRKGIQ